MFKILKNVDQGGAEFNSAPARRLSAAFGLDLAPTTAGNKQVFLAFSMHCSPY